MQRVEHALVRWGNKVVQAAIILWVLAFIGVFAGVWKLQWIWLLYVFATVLVTVILIRWTTAVRERYIREAPCPAFCSASCARPTPT